MGMKRLLKLWALLIVTTFAGEAAALGVVRLSYRDPFAPYIKITPGHSVEALSDYPCELVTEMIGETEISGCQFQPEDGVFSQIAVVASNQIITVLDFNVIPYQMSLGDRVSCWGTPIYLTNLYPQQGSALNLYWNNNIQVLVSPLINPVRPDYTLPITYIEIASTGNAFDEASLLCG